MAMTSSQRPDVVPGNAIDSVTRYHKSSMKYSEFDDGNSSISAMNQGIINYLELKGHKQFFPRLSIALTYFSEWISASYNSASSVSTSQQYSRYNSTMSSSYQETNKVVSRGITEHSSYLSGTIDSSASPNLSRKSKAPKNRQTSVIKNQSVDR